MYTLLLQLLFCSDALRAASTCCSSMLLMVAAELPINRLFHPLLIFRILLKHRVAHKNWCMHAKGQVDGIRRACIDVDNSACELADSVNARVE
jgi:hypothetical protein